jgi:hypothetical protein
VALLLKLLETDFSAHSLFILGYKLIKMDVCTHKFIQRLNFERYLAKIPASLTTEISDKIKNVCDYLILL